MNYIVIKMSLYYYELISSNDVNYLHLLATK